MSQYYPQGFQPYTGAAGQVGSEPCRSVSQGVDTRLCLPKTAWPPTLEPNGGGWSMNRMLSLDLFIFRRGK